MRLQLHIPPALVCVEGQPALLIATRGDRCYVQVSRGAGLNHLRWVPAAALRHQGPPPPTPASGLPWSRPRDQR